MNASSALTSFEAAEEGASETPRIELDLLIGTGGFLISVTLVAASVSREAGQRVTRHARFSSVSYGLIKQRPDDPPKQYSSLSKEGVKESTDDPPQVRRSVATIEHSERLERGGVVLNVLVRDQTSAQRSFEVIQIR